MRRKPFHIHLPVKLLSMLSTGLLLLPLVFLPIRNRIFFSQSAEILRLDASSEKLEKMVFTADEYSRLNFTRAQREFVYRGNMYDVHSTSKSGNQVVVTVLWDAPESRMLLAFQTHDKTDGSALPGVTEVGFMPYFCVDPFSPDFQALSSDQVDHQYVKLMYADPDYRICSPPPELLASL
jgi:hypothetical protein